MNNKEWLEKLNIAYSAYIKQVGPSLPVERFIEWLYQQYMIIDNKTDH
jgi:hypothetical protein